MATDQKALPDDIRVPLDELHADAGYMFGRVAADGSVASLMAETARAKLDALKEAILAALSPPTVAGTFAEGVVEAVARAIFDTFVRIQGVQGTWEEMVEARARDDMPTAKRWHELAFAEARAALAAIRSLPPASGGGEWKMVPVEPTEAMSDAGRHAWDTQVYQASEGPGDMLYRAMLDAAPASPPPASDVRMREALTKALETDLNVTDAELLRIRNDAEHNEHVQTWGRMLQKLVDAIRAARAALNRQEG